MQKNLLNKKLKPCSLNPLTGFERTGFCKTNQYDKGSHLVCGKMSKKFLKFTKKKGNNLYSVVKPGDKWCLCQNRYLEAFKHKKHPKVVLNATNSKIKLKVKSAIKKSLKGGGSYNPLYLGEHNYLKQTQKLIHGGANKKKVILPKLRPISYKNKKHKYKLKEKFSKRKKAIDEGVKMESKKTGYTMKKAALAKKSRFNVLRIYRRYNKVKECNKITKDMRYMDKKYKLGKTKNICGKKKK